MEIIESAADINDRTEKRKTISGRDEKILPPISFA